MRFGLSPQLASEAQNDLRRTILTFAATTPTSADIKAGPAANWPLQLAAGETHPLFTRPVIEAAPPEPEAEPTPKMGIPNAAAQGVDLLNLVGQRHLAPDLAFKDFAVGLRSLNISRAAAAKLTETFAVSLQMAAAAGRAREAETAFRPQALPISEDTARLIQPPRPEGPSHIPADADAPQTGPQGALPSEPMINVVRQGKSDKRTPQSIAVEDIARMIGKASDLLNTDFGGEGTIAGGLQVFGGAADEMVRRGLSKVPFVGETLVERRDQFNEEMGRSFGRLAEELEGFFVKLARSHGLSDEDAENVGKIGPLVVGTIAPSGGPGGRRPRGKGDRPSSEDPDGSADVPDHRASDADTLASNRTQSIEVEAPDFIPELDLPDHVIFDIRANRRVPIPTDVNTVAAARTNIPGFEDQLVEGFSPVPRKLGKMKPIDELCTSDRRIKSPFDKDLHTRHAEEDIFNNLDEKISKAKLTDEVLSGKVVSILISNPRGVCERCLAGIEGLSGFPERGVVRQFSERYPTLTIRFRVVHGFDAANGKAQVLIVKNGKWMRQ